MQLQVQQRPFSEPFIGQLCECADATFPSGTDHSEIRWRLSNMPDAVVHCASVDERFVGFKIAYATRSKRLYSWLGGVRPEYRRQGCAQQLMTAQHEWAKRAGYLNVETGTVRNNHPMLALNLKSGFRIIGTYARAGVIRVLMAKHL